MSNFLAPSFSWCIEHPQTTTYSADSAAKDISHKTVVPILDMESDSTLPSTYRKTDDQNNLVSRSTQPDFDQGEKRENVINSNNVVYFTIAVAFAVVLVAVVVVVAFFCYKVNG